MAEERPPFNADNITIEIMSRLMREVGRTMLRGVVLAAEKEVQRIAASFSLQAQTPRQDLVTALRPMVRALALEAQEKIRTSILATVTRVLGSLVLPAQLTPSRKDTVVTSLIPEVVAVLQRAAPNYFDPGWFLAVETIVNAAVEVFVYRE